MTLAQAPASASPEAAPPEGPTTEASIDSDLASKADAKPAAKLNRITCDPILIGFGYFPVEYERAVSQDLSVAVGLQLSYPALGALFGVSSVGAGLTGELRFFPLEEAAPGGLWIGPQVRGDFVATSAGSVGGAALSVGGLAMVGYTFIAQNGFTGSVGAGLGIGWGAAAASSSGQTTSAAGFSPALAVHANLGYAF